MIAHAPFSTDAAGLAGPQSLYGTGDRGATLGRSCAACRSLIHSAIALVDPVPWYRVYCCCMRNSMSAPFTIGRVAEAAGVGVETVRFYERKGLLAQPRTPQQGFRFYPPDTPERIRFIREAQDLGFTLRETAELLALRAVSKRSRSAEPHWKPKQGTADDHRLSRGSGKAAAFDARTDPGRVHYRESRPGLSRERSGLCSHRSFLGEPANE
jgi:DNA-binding transcriptional MerR regulator